MASVDMCEHDWPGTGCKECILEAHNRKISSLEDRFLDEVENRMLAEARIYELEKICKVHAEDCNEAESILREIIKEWSCSGDVFGAIMKAKRFLK